MRSLLRGSHPGKATRGRFRAPRSRGRSTHASRRRCPRGAYPPRVDTLLAFVAAVVSLRLAAELVRRARRGRRRPTSPSGPRRSLAFALASAALAWGSAAGWDERAFRAYYLFGGLLTAFLLGAGSLLPRPAGDRPAPLADRLHGAGRRDRGLRAGARRLRRVDPGRPGPPRPLPRPDPRDRRQLGGDAGRGRRLPRHVPAAARGQRAPARGRRRRRARQRPLGPRGRRVGRVLRRRLRCCSTPARWGRRAVRRRGSQPLESSQSPPTV